MKIKINRNILWTETFVNELVSMGVSYACISPGSRNTPLTLAFSNNKKIKTFVQIDERSCAFFALGIAKQSGTPVVVVSTSGTATAELYPAIIEAYQSRVPLIICTADRPPELLDCGANQTINQNNIYKNHIRWFFDIGLPEINKRRLKHIKVLARRAYTESLFRSKGPVHLNFPFRKPFEPDSYTDEVSHSLIEYAKSAAEIKKISSVPEENSKTNKILKDISQLVQYEEKGLIIVGPSENSNNFKQLCEKLSELLSYPVLADGTSRLRFGENISNVICNYDAFLRSASVRKKLKAKIIIHFGRTITSKTLDLYLEGLNAQRFMINEFGDWFDPSNKSNAVINEKPELFCSNLINELKETKFKRKKTNWLNDILLLDSKAEKIKSQIIEKAFFPSESRIYSEIIKLLPNQSNIMISNSLPIRDFDNFVSNSPKELVTFCSRGASGIDGITSTALGIAAASGNLTILITGDLAFYHDLNGLLAANKYSIPLIIILINNNGGGIFQLLPISKYKESFSEFFLSPHNLEFSLFVKAYRGKYSLIKSWKSLQQKFSEAKKQKKFHVLEIKTNSLKSLKVRKQYWEIFSRDLF